MYEAVFLDLDGTLRDEAQGIPDTAPKALKRCRENGCRVCLCTGRPLGTIPDDVAALEWDGIIAGGGCYIALGETVLKDAAFAPEHVQNAAHFLLTQKNAAYAFETAQTVFMNREAGEILHGMNEAKWKPLPPEKKRLLAEAQKIPCGDNLRLFSPKTHRVGKLCLWADGPVRERVWEIFAEEPPSLCQDAAFGRRRYWEIIRGDCGKGDAVRQVCSHWGISPERTLAFGDGLNDIEMFRAAGMAVAMGSGDTGLFPYADAICEAPMENGIYLELKRRRLI